MHPKFLNDFNIGIVDYAAFKVYTFYNRVFQPHKVLSKATKRSLK